MLNIVMVRRVTRTMAGFALLLTAGVLSAADPANSRTITTAKKAVGRKSTTNRRAVRDEASARPFDGSGFYLLIVRNPVIQRELNLAPDQIERVEQSLAQIDQPLFALRDAKESESREKADVLLGQLGTNLREILDGAQWQRLWEVIVQARGAAALLMPAVAEELELSTKQTRRIDEVISDTKRGSEAVAKKATKDEKVPSEKLAELQVAGQKKVLAILSPEQQRKLAALAGNRFDLSKIPSLAYKAPPLTGIEHWLNSEPLTLEKLRGKVVALNFFAYG